MKSLSNCRNQRHAGFGVRVVLVMLLAILTGLPAGAEKLVELKVAGYGANGLVLFPAHEVKDFNVVMEAPEVVRADFYDWEFAASSTIIPAPHALVKFMRISQVSSSPDVVRAVVVFNEPLKVSPRRIGKNLVLETSVISRAATGTLAASAADAGSSRNVLDSRVSLSFEQEDLMTILNALAVKFNLRIFADSGVKGRFSVNAQDVTLREILKNLLLQRNFQYALKGRDLTVISLGTDSGRMARELLFRDLSLKDALQTLSKMMNVNLIIHESVIDKKVNFYVENLNLDELLDLLIETSGLVKKLHNDNTFVILARDSAGEFGKKQYRTFKLVNAKPEEVVKMISNSKSLKEKIDVLYTEKHTLIGQVEQLRIQNAHAETQIQELRAQNRELRAQNEKLSAELTCARDARGGMQL